MEMKGRLLKTEDYGWIVTYNDSEELFQFVQLHPDDVNDLIDLNNVFDNVEARISANPDVEFDLFTVKKMDGSVTYAKLKS